MITTDIQSLPTLTDARLLIGALWVTDTSMGSIDHISPMTGRPQATIAMAGPEEIDAAVAAATGAFPGWRSTPPDQRRRLLFRVAEAVESHAEELGLISTLEGGVPRSMAGLGAPTAANWFSYYAGWADKIEGSVVPVYPARGFDYTLPEPYGVVGIIIPWNGPLISIGMKVAPALAAGNCVVLKPPELSPFAAVRFGELALEAGLPPGVLNVLPGGPAAGERLVRHPEVAKVSFTGGGATARAILDAARETLTPVALELGGKSASLLFADADLDVAVPFAARMGMAARSGQGCAFPTRLLVQRPVYAEVLERLQAATAGFVVGDPFRAETTMGPVISEGACNRIMGVIERAVDDGSGRLIAGGRRLGGPFADGYYIEPTVFADVANDSPMAQEEIFGPVLAVIPFGTEEEAVQLANASSYGLAAYINSRDLNRVHRVAPLLAAGSVFVNGHPGGMLPAAPFGGYRQSGYGREGGKPGLDEFLQIKNVYVQELP
ncbi:MAG TPA: aldehyde dehydrogenase family protein [Acidimicrobiales bacterium]|nr:aldehyde dehydrogenase family protein [Acidimicrobiales bacterium]